MSVAVASNESLVLQGPLGLIAPPNIAIECDAFQGTLGALIKCVLHQKIDLWDIPLQPICQAYVEYLLETDENDVDGASTAMVAMAYLIERKAFRLIPLPEPSEEDLLEGLYEGPEIIDFQEALLSLEERFEERQNLFFRSVDVRHEYEIPVSLGKITVADLGRALENLLAKAQEETTVMMSRPRRSLAEQMRVVERCLSHEPRPLETLVEGEFTRAEALWWFLALLELIRLSQAWVELGPDGQVLFSRPAIEG